MEILVMSGQTGGDSLFDNIPLSLIGILMFLSGIAAFITGLISIIFSKERALFVFLLTLMGALVTLFAMGELLFPH